MTAFCVNQQVWVLGEVGGGGTQERKVIHPAPTGIGPSQALFSPGLNC